MDKEKLIHRRAVEAKVFLRVHGFLPDTENDKIQKRIDKYRDDIGKAERERKIPR